MLQVALVVTDADLRPVVPAAGIEGVAPQYLRANGFSAYLRPPDGWEPNEFIRTEMPQVVEACRQSELGVDAVDAALAAYLDAAIGPAAESIGDRPVMAGNSIHTDWFLARRDLPLFSGRLHYRLLDVSSIKTEWLAHFAGDSADLLDKDSHVALREAFPEAELGELVAHDAYYDAQASLAELAWYRSKLARRAD